MRYTTNSQEYLIPCIKGQLIFTCPKCGLKVTIDSTARLVYSPNFPLESRIELEGIPMLFVLENDGKCETHLKDIRYENHRCLECP